MRKRQTCLDGSQCQKFIAPKTQIVDRKINAVGRNPGLLATNRRKFRGGLFIILMANAGFAGLALFVPMKVEHQLIDRKVECNQP